MKRKDGAKAVQEVDFDWRMSQSYIPAERTFVHPGATELPASISSDLVGGAKPLLALANIICITWPSIFVHENALLSI